MKMIILFVLFIGANAYANASGDGKAITGVRTFPNQIELTKEDYALVGEVVWRQLQSTLDPSTTEISDDDLTRAVDEISRSGTGIHFRTSDFVSFIKARQLACGTTASAPGINLDNLGKDLGDIFGK